MASWDVTTIDSAFQSIWTMLDKKQQQPLLESLMRKHGYIEGIPKSSFNVLSICTT